MYPLILHKGLSEQKWFAYPRYKQILMIANELNRAANLIELGKFDQVNLCYERAFELTDLTSADIKWKGRLKELRRFREALGWNYVAAEKCPRLNEMLYKGLIQLSPEAYRLLFPAPGSSD